MLLLNEKVLKTVWLRFVVSALLCDEQVVKTLMVLLEYFAANSLHFVLDHKIASCSKA